MAYSYIDNYKYSTTDREQIDSELEELYTQIKHGKDTYQMYSQIRNYIYKEIKIEELAITKVLNDLLEIKSISDKDFVIITFFVANPMLSYSDIASEYGLTKQRIHQIVNEYATKYTWLNNLIKIKGAEDVKFIKPKQTIKKINMKSEQMELF